MSSVSPQLPSSLGPSLAAAKKPTAKAEKVARQRDQNSIASLGALSRYLWPHWGKLIAATIALSISSGLFFLIGVGLSKLPEVIAEDADGVQNALQQFILIAYAVLAGYGLGLFIRTYLMRWVGERIGVDLRHDVFSKLALQGPSFYDENPYGELQARVTADSMLVQSVIGTVIPNGLHNFLLLITSVAYAFWLTPMLSAVVLACIPAIFLPSIVFSGRVARLAAERQTAQAATGGYVHEILRNLKLVQAYQHEQTAVKRYSGLLDRFFSASVRNVRIEAWLTTVTSFLSYGALTVIVLFGGNHVADGDLTLGELIAFLFYSHLAVSAAAQLVNVYVSSKRAAGAASRLLELRDQPLPVTATRYVFGEDIHSIACKKLNFAYPGRPERQVLNGVDLSLTPGQTVAIVGASGAGKSTLFDLLLRFYEPTSGRIEINGVDLAEIDRQSWLQATAFVPQNPELFSGTVLENLRVGYEFLSEDDVWRALEHAQIDEFVRSLPEGIHTELGQDALRLSGGQRQRLAIARALARAPKLLLLDEPTSALDPESERGIRHALDSSFGELTVLIITHRLDTARRADRIVMLHHGQVLAAGTHDELMTSSQAYAALVRMELEGDRPPAQDHSRDRAAAATGSPTRRSNDD